MSQEYEKIRKITNENDENTKRNVVEEETLLLWSKNTHTSKV